MPPKATTRGRGSGIRGRGRGRGRGKGIEDSDVAPAEPIAPQAVSQTLKVEDDESQSTLSGSPHGDVPQLAPNAADGGEAMEGVEAVGAVEVQSKIKAMEVDNVDAPTDPATDPNASPASQPTETPAPTPLRTAQAPPLAPAVLGEKVKKESRFKPKANRSAKSKLDELADQERKRKAQSAADEARAAGRGRGMDFRNMRGRGRGDAMGRGKVPQSSGTGLWGVAPEMRKFESMLRQHAKANCVQRRVKRLLDPRRYLERVAEEVANQVELLPVLPRKVWMVLHIAQEGRVEAEAEAAVGLEEEATPVMLQVALLMNLNLLTPMRTKRSALTLPILTTSLPMKNLTPQRAEQGIGDMAEDVFRARE